MRRTVTHVRGCESWPNARLACGVEARHRELEPADFDSTGARVNFRHTIVADDPNFARARREIGGHLLADFGRRIRGRQYLDAKFRPGLQSAFSAVTLHELGRCPYDV